MIVPLIVLGLLVWFVSYYTKQVKAGKFYTTRFFDESPKSAAIMMKMKEDGVSEQSQAEFGLMEDNLISIMKSIYPDVTMARSQSQQIKERFMAYDFDYHDDILAWKSKLFDFSPRTSDW
jgi:hypothetical protein